MKRIALILLSIIILIAVDSCKSNENTLEIYLVSSDLPESGENIDINSLDLEETPILTLNDIKRYYWEEQAFVIKKDLWEERMTERFNIEPGKMLVPSYGRPYVVAVNGERIYMGKFWSHLSSRLEFFTPLIYVESFFSEDKITYDLQPDEQVFAITWNELTGDNQEDLRKQTANTIYDERIYNVLKEAGLLFEIEQ